MKARKTHDERQPESRTLLRCGGKYVSIGEVVAGKYLVERVLGVGGVAFVLSARHLELDELFALKFLNEEFVRKKSVVERFMREARAACKIRCEYVARVHDVGTHEGAPFLVMEHLSGCDLATMLADRGALPVEEAVEYTMQVCEALATAHSLGIVHRDIKPENLFVVGQGSLRAIKLLDFGISKLALAGGEAVSRLTGRLTLGTPSYMSPEQIRSTAAADAQSDLWSLGVVLYELLSGVQAFRAATVNELCAAVLETEPPPLRELRPDLPVALADIVATCMQKDPARRFSDAGELAMALVPFAPARAHGSAERSSLTVGVASGRSRVSPASEPTARVGRSPAIEGSHGARRAQHVPGSRSLPPTRHSIEPMHAPSARRSPAERSAAPWGLAALVAIVIAAVATFSVLIGARARPPAPERAPEVTAPSREALPLPAASVAPAAEAWAPVMVTPQRAPSASVAMSTAHSAPSRPAYTRSTPQAPSAAAPRPATTAEGSSSSGPAPAPPTTPGRVDLGY